MKFKIKGLFTEPFHNGEIKRIVVTNEESSQITLLLDIKRQILLCGASCNYDDWESLNCLFLHKRRIRNSDKSLTAYRDNCICECATIEEATELYLMDCL